MRRIHWAAEAQDAHIIEALLRAHGIGAWSFDSGIVRLDWLKTLAFGGCRVMVADVDAERAHHIVAAFRGGALTVADEGGERPCCPRCHRFDGEEDRLPRRLIFLVLIFFNPLVAGLSLLLRASPALPLFAAACIAFNVALVLPGVAAWVVKSRFRCANCGNAWRAPPAQAFAEMSRAVDTHRGASDDVAAAAPTTP